MRVGVDKAGSYGFVVRIYDNGTGRNFVLEISVGSDGGDAAVFDD
jgi:hypothetical protein